MQDSLIDARFKILRPLGEGKAGRVVEAALTAETEYGRPGDHVAIKMYKGWVLDEPNQAERIDREFTAGKQINSPHVVKTHEVLLHSEQPCLVMEFLQGVTLGRWLTSGSASDSQTILRISRDIAAGIRELHLRALIHRDLKPDNVMITKRGAVVMDLGVLGTILPSSLHTQTFLGTIAYAAPEYLFGEKYDETIDVYSFGAILHELVLGGSLVNRGAYWSHQVLAVKEARAPARSKIINPEICGRLGLRFSWLAAALLDGCLAARQRRLSSNQVWMALDGFKRGEPFAHWIDDATRKTWPKVPAELENQVRDLQAIGFRLTDEERGILEETMASGEDSFHGPSKYPYLNRLETVNVLRRESRGFDVALEVRALTPLAIQLVLRERATTTSKPVG